MTFDPDTLPDLKGKVFIVTGGNSGIGYYTVAHLAEYGAYVYMCARSPEKGIAAIANIKKMHPSANIDLLQMDLKDLTSVVAAAKHFLALETALHGLINNAGIMATPFEMTKDGHEAHVRIVNLTSSGHLGAPKGGINFEDPSLKDSGPWPRYGQSKLANILHTKTLHKTYGPGSPSARNGEGEIWVSSVHPGLVETNLATSVGESGSDMKAEQSDTYFEIFRQFGEPRWQSGAAKDAKLAERLEEWTREVMRKEGPSDQQQTGHQRMRSPESHHWSRWGLAELEVVVPVVDGSEAAVGETDEADEEAEEADDAVGVEAVVPEAEAEAEDAFLMSMVKWHKFGLYGGPLVPQVAIKVFGLTSGRLTQAKQNNRTE
ncbi:hypothetical protein DL766_007534 [Monosporascus sp. MC13-8B]|nr:hypothetical protein DL766_007534 [Monosporascus sp. MC13-8B]